MIKNLENQMNWFDVMDQAGSDLGSQSTRMSPEHSVPTTAKTSQPSSKRRSGSSSRKPQIFLCLMGDGQQKEWCMGTDGLLLGQLTTLSSSEFLKGENGYLWSPITGDYLPVKSSLSAILEENADQKYYLSQRACQGILNRAERRGKELPEELKTALLRQASDGSVGG